MTPPTEPELSAELAHALVDGIAALSSTVTSLTESVDADRAERQNEIDRQNEAIGAAEAAARRSRFVASYAIGVAGFAVLAGLAAITLAAVFGFQANDARDSARDSAATLTRFFEERANAQLVACSATNDTNRKINAVVDQDVATLQPILDATLASPDTGQPGRQETIDFYTARVAAYLANRIVLTGPGTLNGERDCSTAGVVAYYAAKPGG